MIKIFYVKNSKQKGRLIYFFSANLLYIQLVFSGSHFASFAEIALLVVSGLSKCVLKLKSSLSIVLSTALPTNSFYWSVIYIF